MAAKRKTTEEGELLTVQQAAARIGVGDTAIRNATLQGRLPFVFKYGRKLIAPADVDAYAARTRPAGVKPKGRPPKTRGTDDGRSTNG